MSSFCATAPVPLRIMAAFAAACLVGSVVALWASIRSRTRTTALNLAAIMALILLVSCVMDSEESGIVVEQPAQDSTCIASKGGNFSACDAGR